MAWIGLLDAQTKQVSPVAYAGETGNYLEKLNIILDESEHGHEHTATALRTGKYIVVNDIASNPQMSPWHENALQLGYRASAAIPINIAGEVRGVLTLYAPESYFFDDDELKLLDEMAADIAFALEFIEKEEQRRQAEDAMRQSNEKFYKIFKTSPDSITITRFSDGEYLEVNQSFMDTTGFKPEDVIGRSSLPGGVALWTKSEDRDFMVSSLTSHGEVIGMEAPLRIKNGEIRIALFSARIIEINGEKCILTIARDITERKRMEEELRESEKNYRELIDGMNETVWVIGFDGNLIDVNKTAVEVLGYSREDLLAVGLYGIDSSLKKEKYQSACEGNAIG